MTIPLGIAPLLGLRHNLVWKIKKKGNDMKYQTLYKNLLRDPQEKTTTALIASLQEWAANGKTLPPPQNVVHLWAQRFEISTKQAEKKLSDAVVSGTELD